MAHQYPSSNESDSHIIPPQPLKLKKPHQPKGKQMGQEKEDESQYLEGLVLDSRYGEELVLDCQSGKYSGKDNNTHGQTPSASKVHNKVEITLDYNATTEGTSVEGEDSGRERLKRHRVEVAGRVWIPDIWGQEEILKDWIDCTAFDAPLVPSRIVMARTALVEEGRRATSGGLRIENRC